MKVRLILVGGFLGAGKTTVLREAARRLIGDKQTVGLVSNDQAPDLVDTATLMRSGAEVREVAGSCFCCNFPGFMGAVKSLAQQGAGIILAEPVGSCTDLSATILQPIKDKYPEIDLAPLTVLVDPERVREVLQTKNSLMHENAQYILRLQMLEADRILLNKVDTLSASERMTMLHFLRESFPESSVDAISARTGEGLEAWLADVFSGKKAGSHIVEVDYDRYAEGEAVLGWLNAAIDLESVDGQVEWAKYGFRLMNDLKASFQSRNAEIGHVKLMIESGERECTLNLTRLGGLVAINTEDAFSGTKARCILNARVQISPVELETIVRDAIGGSAKTGVSAAVQSLRCLMPGRPSPTFRYTTIS